MAKINCLKPLSRVCNVLVREGLYPRNKLGKLQLTKIVLHFGFYALILSCVVMNGLKAFKTGNVMALNHATCIFLPTFNLALKAMAVLTKRKYFLSLMNDLASDVFNSHSEELNEYIKFLHRTIELILRYYTIVMGAYVSITAVLPLVSNAKMMIPAPFELKQYEMIYDILHVSMGAYLALNAASFDILYMSLLGSCIAQLYILEQRLTNIYEESREKCHQQDLIPVSVKEAIIIKECALLYLKIIQFSEKLCTLLSLPILTQYTFGCFIICNTILQLTVMPDVTTGDTIGLIAYAAITFSEMAVYHFLGNEILFKSENIITACYLSKWYKLDTNNQKLLLIFMERAKQPLVIQLYKLVFVSLESLGVVIRWSYSLFALIKVKYT